MGLSVFASHRRATPNPALNRTPLGGADTPSFGAPVNFFR
jgi:hypothetical protein